MTKKAIQYGFNELWMFSRTENRPIPEEPNLRELDFIAEEGFNFVRIPTDYQFWMKPGYRSYADVDERVLELIDRYIAACNERSLHACLNIHRAPGYCINRPELEKHNLWRDAEAEEGFIWQWTNFARRYKHISSDKLSFDLVNEPCDLPPTHPCTREDHARVIRHTVAQIRAVDPQRQIVIDGFAGGGAALPELADLGKEGVIHSGRGYAPFQLTHFKAPWTGQKDATQQPEYPGKEYNKDMLREYYAPWQDVEKQGVQVHIGEFGCYNLLPNDVALRWFKDLLGLYYEYGWGYSLWNFDGPFGIVNHGRPDTVYEEYKGFKVDRALLELLKEHRR